MEAAAGKSTKRFVRLNLHEGERERDQPRLDAVAEGLLSAYLEYAAFGDGGELRVTRRGERANVCLELFVQPIPSAHHRAEVL